MTPTLAATREAYEARKVIATLAPFMTDGKAAVRRTQARHARLLAESANLVAEARRIEKYNRTNDWREGWK